MSCVQARPDVPAIGRRQRYYRAPEGPALEAECVRVAQNLGGNPSCFEGSGPVNCDRPGCRLPAARISRTANAGTERVHERLLADE